VQRQQNNDTVLTSVVLTTIF